MFYIVVSSCFIFSLVVFVTIMTLYQVVTYEHCFGYNVVYISSISSMRWLCYLKLRFHFRTFNFVGFSYVLMFGFDPC
jgi:hypothetical protein